ncbi:MAG: ABC transporter substrate-binding protein [Minisyncoccia bacterium]
MKFKYFFKKDFWKNFWHSLSRTERLIFWSAVVIMAISIVSYSLYYYFTSTTVVPRVGGSVREGYVGQPTTLNPVFAANEIDQSLCNLVYSGLLKSDGKGGIETDLADSYEKSSDGRHWVVRLRKDVFWHDGVPFTADDVIFTISTIQNSETNSPYRVAWQGVTVTKISDYTLTFDLKNPYAFFEENLKQKIIPKHIFDGIPLVNIKSLSQYNFEPIGTGPFKYQKFDVDKKGYINYYIFVANPRYYNGRPYINNYIVKFYKSENEMLKAFEYHQLDLINNISANNLENINRSHNLYTYILPQYFAVFFNGNISRVLADKNVRYALNYATNRFEILDKVFNQLAEPVEGPLLRWMKGYETDLNYEYSVDKAKQILLDSGWSDNDGDGILEKVLNKGENPTPLKFTLTVPSANFLIETASLLKKQWREIGADVTIQIVNPQELQENYLMTRLYDALIYGNIINQDPDLFPFWHSSQKFYPGLNLALYENQVVDKLLEEVRMNASSEAKSKDLTKIYSLILSDAPAVFLYNPKVLMVTTPSLKIENLKRINISADRYFNVHQWYLKTKRVTTKSLNQN